MALPDELEASAPGEEITVQSVFDTLGSARTRHMVRVLADAPPEEPVPFSDLAEGVTARETEDETDDDVAIRTRSVSLYQTHLPRLTEIGAILTDGEDDLQVIPHRDVQTLAAILDDVETRVGQLNGEPRFPGSSVVTAFIDFFRRRRHTSR